MAVIKDVNRIPGLRKEFRRANRRRTEVGIFEDAPALVKIGVLNEFGVRVRVDEALARGFLAWAKENNYPTDNLPREGEELIIPERSFMRATFDEYVDKVVMKGGEALAQARDLLLQLLHAGEHGRLLGRADGRGGPGRAGRRVEEAEAGILDPCHAYRTAPPRYSVLHYSKIVKGAKSMTI